MGARIGCDDDNINVFASQIGAIVRSVAESAIFSGKSLCLFLDEIDNADNTDAIAVIDILNMRFSNMPTSN